ncbi:MAG: hypothetical protein H7836_16160 [Magnetococcus sp. YQC-3]
MAKQLSKHEERKYHEVDKVASGALVLKSNVTPTTNTVCLTNIPPGSTYQQRIGNEVKLKGLSIKYEIVVQTAGTLPDPGIGLIRMMIWRVRDWEVYNPTTGYLPYNMLAKNSDNAAMCLSHYTLSPAYKGGFKVYYDKVIQPNASKTVSTPVASNISSTWNRFGKIYFKFPSNMIEKFTSTLADSSARNHIFISVFGTLSTSLDSAYCRFYSRLVFTE